MDKNYSLSEKICKALGEKFSQAIGENKRLLVIVLTMFILTMGIASISNIEGDNQVKDIIRKTTEPVRKEIKRAAEIERSSAGQLAMYIRNNLTVMIWTIGMGIGFGLYPLYQIFMNSAVIGYVGVELAKESSATTTISILLPHGVFELTGLILSATIGLRIGLSSIKCVKNRTTTPLKETGNKIAPILPPVFILIITAGFVEAFISPITGSIAFNLAKIFTSIAALAIILFWISGRLIPDVGR